MKTKTSSLIQVAITANILEWYDFSISGFLAIVLGQLFFSGHDAFAAIIKSFSVFAASYLMRPLGSMAYGYLGNKRGPGVALQSATLMMAIPTVLMGLLPTYREIGHAATVLMVLLKLLQGFAAGGEFPLSAYFVATHAAQDEKGRMSSLVHVGGSCGILLASFCAFLLGSLFTHHEISRWAWRIPFLLSIPLALAILKLRSGMIDGQRVPCDDHRKYEVRLKVPAIAFIRGALLVASMEVGFYTLLVWLPNYAEIFLGYSSFDAHLSNTLALIIYTLTILASGFFSRYIEYKNILVVCLSLIVILAYPLFVLLLQIHAFALLLSIQGVFSVLYGAIGGVILITLYNLFKNNGGSFGLAVTFTLPTALFGGTAPLVCSYLVHRTHYLIFPAFYIAFFSLFALPVAWGLKSPEAIIQTGPATA